MDLPPFGASVELLERIAPALTYIDRYWDKLRANARDGHPDRFEQWAGMASTSFDGHLDDQDPKKPYILYLPNDFITPGGRFMVQFYWDSYFALLGLVRCGRVMLAKGIVENCFHLIDQHGMVIANRKRWAAGSQLPFLSSMVAEIDERIGDTDWLRRAAGYVEREYTGYWMNEDHLTECGLSRYHAPSVYPASAIPAITMDHEASWDLSPRFERHDVLHLLPVDLNCNLYLYEKHLAQFWDKLGETETSASWQQKADRRKRLINELLWHEGSGMYLDYDIERRVHKPVYSLATYFPLYCGLCDKERAGRVHTALARFEQPHGLATCEETYGFTDRQWNYPLGWAPLHWIVVQALRRAGFHEDADRITTKWLSLNVTVWQSSGAFYEKYDVVSGSAQVLTDRYKNQEGFAWTNGVFVALADDLRERRVQVLSQQSDVPHVMEMRKLEYDNLSKEIVDNSTKNFQVVVFCTGAIAAMISWILTVDVNKFPLGAEVFPFAILALSALLMLPSMLLIESHLRSSARIAGYLKARHEGPGSGLHWQTALQGYRENQKTKKKRGLAKSFLYVFWGLAALTILSSFFAIVGVPKLTDHSAPPQNPPAYVFTIQTGASGQAAGHTTPDATVLMRPLADTKRGELPASPHFPWWLWCLWVFLTAAFLAVFRKFAQDIVVVWGSDYFKDQANYFSGQSMAD